MTASAGAGHNPRTMQMYFGLDDLPEEPLEPVVTMGNFDGVHRGHQALLARVQEEGSRMSAPTMVITFHPHPRQVLRPEEPFTPIMSLKERMRRLWDLRIDHALILPFDHDMAEMTGREFIEEVLWDALRIRGIYVGAAMTFGYQRQGNVKLLESEGRRLGYGVGVIDPVLVEGYRVSSTLIRQAVASGQLEVAARLLGRNHRVVGTVVEGDKRGRELGFPTANLETDGGVLPPNGVYAAWALLDDGATRVPAVVNIGVRPTFTEGGPVSVEAHLLDFEGDLYGQEVALALVRNLRGEQQFGGVEPLKRQIKRDVIEARRALGVPRA